MDATQTYRWRRHSRWSSVGSILNGGVVLLLVAAVAAAAWWQLLIGAGLLIAVTMFPAGRAVLGLAVAQCCRWVAGRRMLGGGYRPATFLAAAVPPPLPPHRFGLPRVHWSFWPGWQRMLVRWFVTALAVVWVWWPMQTDIATASVLVVVGGTAGAVRYRAHRRARPVKVLAARRQPVAAITAGPAATPAWVGLPQAACAGSER